MLKFKVVEVKKAGNKSEFNVKVEHFYLPAELIMSNDYRNHKTGQINCINEKHTRFTFPLKLIVCFTKLFAETIPEFSKPLTQY